MHRHSSASAKLSYGPTVEKKPAIVVMPLDASLHSDYCLQFYITYLHKQGNKVFVVYVSEPVITTSSISIQVSRSTSSTEGFKDKCITWTNRFFSSDHHKDRQSETSDVRGIRPSPGIMQELEKEDWDKCKALRHKVKMLFNANAIPYEFKRIIDSDPCRAIKAIRKEVNGTMIVMGSRGLGAIERRIFGSVSEKVLREAVVPVLVVKKPKPRTSKASLDSSRQNSFA